MTPLIAHDIELITHDIPLTAHDIPLTAYFGRSRRPHMKSRTGSIASVCASLALLVTMSACKGPSHRSIRASTNAPPVTVTAPTKSSVADVPASRVTDVPAGDSATFGGREYLAGDTLFSFADYHTAAADIEHLERRTDSLITVASLVLPVRYKRSVVLHACTLDGAFDAEILAVYTDEAEEPNRPAPATARTANSEVHPRFAWRASRARERFETVDPRRVLCSFADVVD